MGRTQAADRDRAKRGEEAGERGRDGDTLYYSKTGGDFVKGIFKFFILAEK